MNMAVFCALCKTPSSLPFYDGGNVAVPLARSFKLHCSSVDGNGPIAHDYTHYWFYSAVIVPGTFSYCIPEIGLADVARFSDDVIF